ncbi:hypothetical protein EDD18DRAFT_1470545 [Armillaria luteobubalina]|uniref:Uncharacterized protein n=1 Tax=Armillaria luteobubalina TaxID=153913 RepID=A0AA39NZY4_9AGAR|nr:hypothetical protein EDD18DRAFT_1470545 [Armillaria luteobubalina]
MANLVTRPFVTTFPSPKLFLRLCNLPSNENALQEEIEFREEGATAHNRGGQRFADHPSPTSVRALVKGRVASCPAAFANLHNTPVPDHALLNTPPRSAQSSEDLDEEAEAECDDDDAEFPENSVWPVPVRVFGI